MDRVQNNVLRHINERCRWTYQFSDVNQRLFIVERWTLLTLKKEIIKNSHEPPLLVIERFYDELTSYTEMLRKNQNAFHGSKSIAWHDFNYARQVIKSLMRELGVC